MTLSSAKKTPAGAVYTERICRVERGEVRMVIPLGAAMRADRGRLTLELNRLIVGDDVIDLETPLAVTVALSSEACAILAAERN